MRTAVVVEQCWQPVPGGSGTYVVELTRALAAAGVDQQGLTAWHRAGHRPSAAPTVRRTVASPLPRRVLYDAWNHAALPRAEHLARGVDVVHATTWAVPPTRRPLVVTVHDVAFRRVPEHFTARGVRYFERALRRVVGEADAVLVPSSSTRDDVVEAGVEPGRVTVVPLGVTVPAVTAQDAAEFRRTFSLARPYVLWVGTREPRKNLDGVLAGFRASALAATHDLVLVGPGGWGEAATERVDTTAVRDLGPLSTRDLQRAYAGAAVFCFPSWWEGFGLPVLEAMAHGVPVVTSRATSMAEFATGAGVLVDPHDAGDIGRGLREAAGPEGSAWGRAGAERALGLTWEATADATLRLYRDLVRDR